MNFSFDLLSISVLVAGEWEVSAQLIKPGCWNVSVDKTDLINQKRISTNTWWCHA